MIHVTCRLTAKNQDQLQNPTLGNRVWATFTFFSYLELCTELKKVHTTKSMEIAGDTREVPGDITRQTPLTLHFRLFGQTYTELR